MNVQNAFSSLLENIKTIINQSHLNVVRNINQAMVLPYFQIGKMIVECEQRGNPRAEYAKETILLLSDELSREFGKGYSVSNLEYMRSFYITYQHRISQSLIGDMEKKPKSQSVIGILENPFQ